MNGSVTHHDARDTLCIVYPLTRAVVTTTARYAPRCLRTSPITSAVAFIDVISSRRRSSPASTRQPRSRSPWGHQCRSMADDAMHEDERHAFQQEVRLGFWPHSRPADDSRGVVLTFPHVASPPAVVGGNTRRTLWFEKRKVDRAGVWLPGPDGG
jgi:hypothetical protein